MRSADSQSSRSIPTEVNRSLPHSEPISFWTWNWIPTSLVLLPINLLPTLLILLGGTGVGIGRQEWRRPDLLTGLVGALLLWMLLITVWAYDPQRSVLGAANHLPFLMFFVIASCCLRSDGIRERVAQVIVMGSIFISVLGLGQTFLGWQGRLHLGPWMILKVIDWPRPTSVFTSHNILAIYLVIALGLGAGLYLQNKARRWVVLAYLLGLPLLILTASRNGWGIACVGLLIGLIAYRLWIWLGLLMGFCGLCLGAALGIPGLRLIIPALIWERLAATFDPTSSFFSSTLNRIDAWQFALQMIQSRPWQGWGWQSFPMLYNAQIPPPDERLHHCHNLYLTLGAEGGLPVLIGFVVIWGWVLYRGWQIWIKLRRSAERVPQSLELSQELLKTPESLDLHSSQRPQAAHLVLAYLVVTLCYLISGLLDAVFFDGRINVLVWVLLAAINGAWWQDRDLSQASSWQRSPDG